MSTNPDWPSYLRAITEGELNVQIAERAGVSDVTISRWMKGTARPRPDQVIVVARAYGQNPIAGLIASGYLTEDDVKIAVDVPRKLQLRDFTELELAEEQFRRLRDGTTKYMTVPGNDHPAMRKLDE